MITVIGEVVAQAGLTQNVDALGNAEPYTLPANSYLREQAAVIPLVTRAPGPQNTDLRAPAAGPPDTCSS
jgi:hypothetical protein